MLTKNVKEDDFPLIYFRTNVVEIIRKTPNSCYQMEPTKKQKNFLSCQISPGTRHCPPSPSPDLLKRTKFLYLQSSVQMSHYNNPSITRRRCVLQINICTHLSLLKSLLVYIYFSFFLEPVNFIFPSQPFQIKACCI